MEKPIGLLLKQVEHLYTQRLQKKMDQLGIPKSFVLFLIELKRQDGISQATLASRIRFSAPTVSVTLQNLETAGYIRRTPSPDDQRQSLIFLTEVGKQIEEGIHDRYRCAERELTEPLSAQETEQLRSLLSKLIPEDTSNEGEHHQP